MTICLSCIKKICVSFQLTNRTSRSEYGSASDDDTLENLDGTGNSVVMNFTPEDDSESTTKKDFTSSTPEKPETHETDKTESANQSPERLEENAPPETEPAQTAPESHINNTKENVSLKAESPKISQKTKVSPKTESKNFLQSERCLKSPQKSPKFGRKMFTALLKPFSRHKTNGIETLGMLLRI